MEAHRFAAAALAAALSATPPLTAQRPAVADTLLSRLTAEALAASLGLGILDGRARAASARVRAAGALPDPGLSLTAMDLTLPHLRFRESDFTEVDLEARQEFPWPGTLGVIRSSSCSSTSTALWSSRRIGRRTAALD